MGRVAAEVVRVPQNTVTVKVHSSVCNELMKIVDIITGILPVIESAQPGWTAGMQELCSLNNTIQKARLLLQHCTESSMLYLALTGESVRLKCERIRSSLNHSLCLVQSMVPQTIASQISVVLDYLKDVRFIIDPTDDEAGKAMLELLQQTDSSEELEFKAFQTARSNLKITSPKSLLRERRSIKKLLAKIQDADPKKERILKYFLYLINKHGKKEITETKEQKMDHISEDKCLISDFKTLENRDESGNHNQVATNPVVNYTPPEEFCCPITLRLMYDPVVIASGQTFERASIEKWFNEGHATCPRTQKKLENLHMIPNSCMKDLISNWCKKHNIISEDVSAPVNSWVTSHCSSISSLRNVSTALLDGSSGSYMHQSDISNVSFLSSDASYCSDSSHVIDMDCPKDNFRVRFSTWCNDYLKSQSFSSFSSKTYLRFFDGLCELPLDIREKAVEDLKVLLENDEEVCYMLSDGFIESLMMFLKNAYDMSNVHAQKTGAGILLAYLNNKRVEIPSLGDDIFGLLTSFLESEITKEALLILQKLPSYQNSKSIISVCGLPRIVKVLDCKDTDTRELAIKILYDLSLDRDLNPLIGSSGCIPKLVCLLSERRFAEICLKVLDSLCYTKEAMALIAETKGSIASIVDLLEYGSRKEQEHGVSIFHSLCSQSMDYCFLVMKEGVIPSLVDISVNGNSKGSENSMKLLNLLKDLRLSGSFENSEPQPGPMSEPPISEPPVEDVKQPKFKSSGFFGRKMKFFKILGAVPRS